MDEADLRCGQTGLALNLYEDLGCARFVLQHDHFPQLVIRGQFDGIFPDDVFLGVLPSVIHLTHQAVVTTQTVGGLTTQVQLNTRK